MPVPRILEYLKVHYQHGECYTRTIVVISQPEEEAITKVILPKRMHV